MQVTRHIFGVRSGIHSLFNWRRLIDSFICLFSYSLIDLIIQDAIPEVCWFYCYYSSLRFSFFIIFLGLSCSLNPVKRTQSRVFFCLVLFMVEMSCFYFPFPVMIPSDVVMLFCSDC